MYIWFGINIDNNIVEFKKNFLELTQKYNAIPQFNYHPAHISLKITSEIKDELFEPILDDCFDYYKTLTPFKIKSDKIEIENSFMWLRWLNNDNLESVHTNLCDLMNIKYKIPLHQFDYEYKYHTTLFANADKLNKELTKEIYALEIPQKITASNFFIGFSKDNKSENFKIYKSIELGE